MKIDRLLSIIIRLLNRDTIPALTLADEFEVSIRTIYRDIETINTAGVPIISYPGPTGGFGIAENYRLDRQVLNLTDMTTILSALKGIRGALEDRELDTAIEKIDSLVPKGRKNESLLQEEQLAIDIMPWGYRAKQKRILKIVYKAISEKKLLSFTYKNSKGEKAERTVEPMTLLFKGYAWYLFAFCRLRKDYRIFRLSRIGDPVIPGKGFIKQTARWQDYIDTPKEDRPMIDIVLRFEESVRFRMEDYFGEENLRECDDGRIETTVSFAADEWIYSFLMSFGDEIEVMSPGHVRSEFIKKLEKISSYYKKP